MLTELDPPFGTMMSRAEDDESGRLAVEALDLASQTSTPMGVKSSVQAIVMLRGACTWSMGESSTLIMEGDVLVSWRAFPHSLVAKTADASAYRVNVPLELFLSWESVAGMLGALFSGRAITIDSGMDAFAAESVLQQWPHEVASGDALLARSAQLGAEAAFCRLAARALPQLRWEAEEVGFKGVTRRNLQKVGQIVEYVAKNFTASIRVADVARAVGLVPASVSRLFRRVCGMSLVQFIILHRIFHAGQLLQQGRLGIPEVIQASGFRSPSPFYASFRKFHGTWPTSIRRNAS